MANQNFKVKKGLEVGTALTATSDGLNVTGIITATQFSGDGSGLTGITASGSGVVVQEEGSSVGTAATINFIGSNVTAALSGGVANVTVSAGSGGISNVVEDTTPQLGGNLDLNSKDITGTGNISITGGFNATGVSTFQESVTFQSHASFGDNDKVNFGAGQDLQIYHDGSHSFIKDVGTGNLYIGADQNILLTNPAANEFYASFNNNGAVELYYDNSKKFETKSDGIDVTGELQCDSLDVDGAVNIDGSKVTYDSSNGLKLADSTQLRLGTGNDLRLYHDGSHSYIQDSGVGNLKVLANSFILKNAADNEFLLRATQNSTVELLYDNSKKLETKSDGIDVTGEVQCDSLDVDGNADISGTVSFGSTVTFGDDDRIRLGDSNEFDIYYSGGRSYIKSGVGQLRVKAASSMLFMYENQAGTQTESYATFSHNGAVSLFYDGSKKFETTNHGAIITGVATATSFSGSGSSLTGLTGASAGTYGASNNTPIITVDSNGRITGISTVATAGAGGGGGISNIVEDTTPQLGGNLDLNSKDITGSGDLDYTGNLKVTGISTITGVAGFSSHITLPDHAEIQLGNATGGDLKIYHSGTDSIINDVGTGSLILAGSSQVSIRPAALNEFCAVFNQNGSVQLYHDNALRLQTTGTGVDITDDLNVAGISTFADNAYFNDEVTINRSTTNTALSVKFSNVLKGRLTPEGGAFKVSANGTNDLRLVCNDSGGNSGDVQIATGSGAGKMALFTGSGTAELYYQDSKKFETTNTGATVTGTLTATAFSGDGSALTNLPASGITTSQSNTQVTYNIGASGNNYVITGPGYSNSDNNPDLYLVRGQRYRFINATGSSHPFRIQSDTSGTAYTDGVSGSQSGTQEFNVQHDAPSRLFYQCTIHSGMIGNIYITGGGQWENTSVAASGTPEIYTDYNVGIGTNNPTAKLDVDGTLNVSSSARISGASVTLDNSASYGNLSYSPQLFFKNNNSSNSFYIWKDNAFNMIEVQGSDDLIIRARDSGSDILIQNRTNEYGIKVLDAAAVELYYNNSKKLETTSAGIKVGSNTLITPSTDADNFVIDTGDVDSGISILSATTGRIYFGDAASNDQGSIRYVHTDNSMRFETNSTEKLRILSDGKVAIGGVTANSLLDVHGGDGISITSSGDTFLQSRTTGTTGTNYLEFKDSGGGSGAISYHHDGNSMRFKVSGSERLRITSGGTINCGHGDAVNLHSSTTTGINLNGNGNSGQIVANASGNRALIIGRQTNYGQVIEFFQGTNANDAAITIPAANSFGIQTAATERLRITSDGKIGINETSPGCQTGGIHAVHDSTEGTPTFTGGEVGIFQRNYNSSQGCHIGIIGGSSGSSSINFGDKDDADVGIIQYTHSNNSMRFYVNTSERLRIQDAPEAVRVIGTTADTGTTGGSKGLTLQTGGGTSCPLYFGSETNSAQKSMYMTGYWIYLRGHQNEGIRFVFSQAGGNAPRSDQYQFKYNQATRPTGNTTWDGFSDRRAKENVQDVTSALDTICRLRPVTFDWTNDYADRMNMFNMDKSDPKSYMWTSVKENGYDEVRKNNNVGFIAQEFEEVFPKDITETEMELGNETITDFKTVNFDSLVPMLTKAVQELKAENDSLKARITALES